MPYVIIASDSISEVLPGVLSTVVLRKRILNNVGLKLLSSCKNVCLQHLKPGWAGPGHFLPGQFELRASRIGPGTNVVVSMPFSRVWYPVS